MVFLKTMSETECFRVIGKFEGGEDEEEKKFFLLIDPSSSIEDVENRIAQVIPNLPSKLKDNINLYIDDVYLPKYESAQIIKKKDVLTIRDKMPIARKRKRHEIEVEKNEDVAVVENVDVHIDAFEPAELPKRKRKRKRKKKEVSLESSIEETSDKSKLNGSHSNGELASLFNLQHRKVFRKSLISQNGVDEVKQKMDVDEIKPIASHVRFDDEIEEQQTPKNDSNVNSSFIKKIEIENCSVITDNKYENDSIILFQVMKLDENYCPIISDFILAKIISIDDNEGSLSVKVLEGADQLEVPQGKFFMEDESAEEAQEDKIIKYCDIKYSYLVPSDLVQFNNL